MTSMYNCPHCDSQFAVTEAHSVVVPDDRDQMYGRPLGGTMEVDTCPHCGSDDLEEYSDYE